MYDSEKARTYKRSWRIRNLEKSRAITRRWHAKNLEKVKAIMISWRIKNPEKSRERGRRRYAKPGGMIENRLRTRLRGALKGIKKTESVRELVGCSREELIIYIESSFRPGMTWNNKSEWHIDHRRPCSSFDLTDPMQQRECFHYTNLQPLWAIDNLSKGSR